MRGAEYPWQEREINVKRRIGEELALLIPGIVLLFPILRVTILDAIKDLVAGIARMFLTKLFADAVIRIRPWMIIFSAAAAGYFQSDFIYIYSSLKAIRDILFPQNKFMSVFSTIFKLYSTFYPVDESMAAFTVWAIFLTHGILKSSFGFIDLLLLSYYLYSANRRTSDAPVPYAVKLVLTMLN